MSDIFLRPGAANPNDIVLVDPTVATGSFTQTLTSVGGLAGAEAFGAGKLNQGLTAGGVVTQEGFGSGKLNGQLRAVGIAGAESFGAGQMNQRLTAVGIVSQESLGGDSTNEQLHAVGIAGAEALGVGQVNLRLLGAGGTSAEAFGSGTLSGGAIPDPVVSLGDMSGSPFQPKKAKAQTLYAPGIAGLEAFGAGVLRRVAPVLAFEPAALAPEPPPALRVAPAQLSDDEAIALLLLAA
jgi:hypothetical protein